MKFFKEIQKPTNEANYRRDAYQRDVDNSTSGFGRDSYAYQQDGGANDERHDLDPSEWYIVKDSKMYKVTVYPNQEQEAKARGYSPSREEARAKASKEQGVAEGMDSDSPVAGAITRRILMQRHDLLSKYGPQKVMAAIDDVADFVGDTDEIGSSDVSGWIKQVEQSLAGMGEAVDEASLAQMRDYFNQPDDSMSVNRAPARTGKPNPNVPQEIQILINKMYHSGKVSPEEFKILQDFQRKTKINVGVKEADMSTGNQGYDGMLAVMKAVDAGQDATFDLGGEPVTLDYNEARFLAGRYKAFLKAGRQEEFLKYMESPVAFDRLMKQLRDLMDKQKNFKGSVEGERGLEEDSQRVDSLVTDALKIMRGSTMNDAIQALKTVLGDREFSGRRGHYNFYVRQLMDMYSQQGMAENMQSLPAVNENEYWCQIDSTAKPIPEGYKKLASGYITKVSK